MKNMSEIMFAQYAGDSVIDAVKWWVTFMVCLSIALMIFKSLSIILFAKVGHNIVQGVRKELYEAVLRKHMGWHDDRQNASGVISATLASDVQTLNGASSEGAAAILEAMASLLFGLLLGFIYSWPMALVGLCLAPFLVIGSYI